MCCNAYAFHDALGGPTVTRSRPQGESNGEHTADLHTGGVLSTRPHPPSYDRAARFAAVGVALVHRDAAEVRRERLHHVDHRGRPGADAGVQAPPGVTSSGKPEPASS